MQLSSLHSNPRCIDDPWLEASPVTNDTPAQALPRPPRIPWRAIPWLAMTTALFALGLYLGGSLH